MTMLLTAQAAPELEHIRRSALSEQEAFAYLNNEIKLLSFSEILLAFSGEAEAPARLIAALCSFSPEIKPESVAKKVKGWYADRYAPDDREELFKICFALGFDEKTTHAFLSFAGDGGFHLRDPRELVYAYAMRVGKSYFEAQSLLQSLPPLGPEKSKPFVLTKTIASAFAGVYDDESFRAFYKAHHGSLGELHNTAYVQFSSFLEMLIKPDGPLYAQQDRDYSIQRIVEEYLRMDLPFDRRMGSYSLVQKAVKKYWPNTTNIIRMRSREEDVTRRVLLLLYLITEGGVAEDAEDDGWLDDDATPEERFEEQYWRVNSMLTDCGMARLDPRNIFDWIVLYALKTEREDAMSDRMQAVLNAIFEERK